MSPGPLRSFTSFWHKRPLSAQLVALITVLLALGLSVSGTVMLGLLQRHLISQIDEQLKSATSAVLSSDEGVFRDGESALPTLYYIRTSFLGHRETVSYYRPTLDQSGTPHIPQLLAIGQEPGTEDGMTHPVTVSSSKHGSNWRAAAFPVYSNSDGQIVGVITIALPLSDVQRTLRTTTTYFTVVGILIVILGASLGSTLVRRSLLPLRSIESTAGKIAAGDLTQRVAPQPPSTEVGSLALSLNAMLSQVEQSFQARQTSERKIRRFVSDASHELRTPLAAISGYCELYSMGGIPHERIPEVMGRIQSESTRMAALVEDLLTLARLDEGRPLEFTEIDLVKLADNAAFDLQALDPTRCVGLRGLGPGTPQPPMTLVVTADRDRIQQVYTNIIGNIVRYTPEGSPVEIALGKVGAVAVVEFRDHGPGIAEGDRSKVFERFYRSDSSRARSQGGSGLGLAIVSAILSAHKGQAKLTKTKGGGLTVRIELPLETQRSITSASALGSSLDVQQPAPPSAPMESVAEESAPEKEEETTA